jgi:hypothetical protein
MASLEGLGIHAPSWLVSAKSGGCRAFRVPQRHIWRWEERLLAVAPNVANRAPRFADTNAARRGGRRGGSAAAVTGGGGGVCGCWAYGDESEASISMRGDTWRDDLGAVGPHVLAPGVNEPADRGGESSDEEQPQTTKGGITP